MAGAQPFLLGRAHAGCGLDQKVAPGQRAQCAEFAQQDFGQLAAAGPQFHNVAATQRRKDFGALARQRAAEQRRGFGGGVEVPAFAEACPARAVVALFGVV